MYTAQAVPNSPGLCTTCGGQARVLHFWSKPGGMGNGWGGCPDCPEGRAYSERLKAERFPFDLPTMAGAHADAAQTAVSMAVEFINGRYPPWMTEDEARSDTLRRLHEALTNHIPSLRERASGKFPKQAA